MTWSPRSRAAAAAAVLVALCAASLVAVGVASTATTLEVHLTSAVSDGVTVGGTAGYHLSVDNTGDSTVTQVSVVVATTVVNAATTAAATFESSSASGAVTCAASADDASQMLCTGSQLAAGQGFTVDFAFRTPTAAPADPQQPVGLEARASVTVSAQTQGAPGNNGTSQWYPPAAEYPVAIPLLAASASSVSTYALSGTDLATGRLLRAQIGLPTTFLNGFWGLATSAAEVPGSALCTKCPSLFLALSIPASLTPTSPFSATNPFAFTITLDPDAQAPGYKPKGLVHDGVPVPMCTSPTSVDGGTMCVDTFTQAKKTRLITVTGRGYENGFIGFD